MIKNIITYLVAIILIIFILNNYVTAEHLALLRSVSIWEILISLLLGILIFSISGFQFSYILNAASQTKLSNIDKITFPISRNLWSYIIPFQGSFAYSLAFCKLKYKVKLGKGFSINIYMLILNIFFTGIIGIYFSFANNFKNNYIFIVSVIFLFFPIFVILLEIIFNHISNFKNKKLQKIKMMIHSIIRDISLLWKNIKFTLTIILFNIVHTIVTVFWFYWTVKILNLDVDIISILFLTMILKISLIFRITPGNLGIEQLLSGGVFVLLGENGSFGITISLFNKFITLFLSGTIGLAFTFYNIRYFKGKNIFNYLKSIKK